MTVPDRMAGPGEARSVAAIFLAAGARPDEIDAAVAVLIELIKGRPAPTTYEQVADQPIEALAELRRRRNRPTVVDEEHMDERDYRAPE